MYYQAPDSKRRKICPFSEHPKAYGVELWDSARFQDYVSTRADQMEVGFSFLCLLKPAVALCYIPAEDDYTSCEDIPNSTALETESSLATGSVYTIENVDTNPRLCFKFSLGNSSHFHCPHNRGSVWTVTAEAQLLHLVLTFSTRINTSASFSATTCTKSEHGQCPPTESIYTVSRASGSSREKLVLILPFQFGESCVLVWRSDVRIAVKELICPDYSRRRDGLLAIAVLAVILLVIVGLLLNYRSLRKAARAPLWHRTVLLVYSSDSEQYKIAICAFADFLHSTLGCNVILDLWDVGRVTQMGILPWLYSKKELVEREKGKVIVVWTQYSSKLYQLWNSKNTSSSYAADPHNLFGAAMSCLQSDMNTLAGKERLRDYVLVYFDGLCEKQDIPTALKRIPRYRLFKDLHRLVNALQHKPQGPPCWIRARAKFLIQKLVKSDKSTSLQGRMELCRLQQPDGYGWHKEIPETKIDSCLY
ncbi:interleukin-17 receptor E [Ambystoma mexicanum]|uniref:interleukin-17 receptor E n=1 Tax=Ambystoma mexicanum TaxID=8296 RepID=UPI0037E8699B